MWMKLYSLLKAFFEKQFSVIKTQNKKNTKNCKNTLLNIVADLLKIVIVFKLNVPTIRLYLSLSWYHSKLWPTQVVTYSTPLLVTFIVWALRRMFWFHKNVFFLYLWSLFWAEVLLRSFHVVPSMVGNLTKMVYFI